MLGHGFGRTLSIVLGPWLWSSSFAAVGLCGFALATAVTQSGDISVRCVFIILACTPISCNTSSNDVALPSLCDHVKVEVARGLMHGLRTTYASAHCGTHRVVSHLSIDVTNQVHCSRRQLLIGLCWLSSGGDYCGGVDVRHTLGIDNFRSASLLQQQIHWGGAPSTPTVLCLSDCVWRRSAGCIPIPM